MTAHLDKARECQCSCSRLHFNPLPVSGISALCCDWTVSVKRFKSRLNYTPLNWPNLELHSLFLIISSVWSYRWALTVCVYMCVSWTPSCSHTEHLNRSLAFQSCHSRLPSSISKALALDWTGSSSARVERTKLWHPNSWVWISGDASRASPRQSDSSRSTAN